MRKALAGAIAGVIVAIVAFAGNSTAEAGTHWKGHFETPYVLSDPHNFAALDIGHSTHGSFTVLLHNAIPVVAFPNDECNGPGDGTGTGTPTDATHLAVEFSWLCWDGSTTTSTRVLRFNDHSDGNPANDEMVLCLGDGTACGLVFHRTH